MDVPCYPWIVKPVYQQTSHFVADGVWTISATKTPDIYAKSAGITLGKIVSISENTGSRPPIAYPMRAMAAMDASVATAPVPVQSGELSYSVDVVIQWELADQ